MKPKVYIDGKEGTTGLQIYERLGGRDDIELLLINDEKRKDPAERKKYLNAADIVFLASCLLPSFSITSLEGPINAMLQALHSAANLLFSERKPKPGCIASAFTATVALSILSIFK